MPRQAYIRLKQIPQLYAEARASFESYDINDLKEDGQARVIVDTILSAYGFTDDEVVDAACTFGATIKDARADMSDESDGNYYALEDGAELVASFINRHLPKDAIGSFYFDWEDGAYCLEYGVDIES